MKTKKLQEKLIKYQEDEINGLQADTIQIVDELNHANSLIESQNTLIVNLHSKIEQLQSALSKFEDLKKDLEGVAGGDCSTIWVTHDKDGDVYIFNEKPEYKVRDRMYYSQNGQAERLSNRWILGLKMENMQCKQYRLLEVQDENQN